MFGRLVQLERDKCMFWKALLNQPRVCLQLQHLHKYYTFRGERPLLSFDAPEIRQAITHIGARFLPKAASGFRGAGLHLLSDAKFGPEDGPNWAVGRTRYPNFARLLAQELDPEIRKGMVKSQLALVRSRRAVRDTGTFPT